MKVYSLDGAQKETTKYLCRVSLGKKDLGLRLKGKRQGFSESRINQENQEIIYVM